MLEVVDVSKSYRGTPAVRALSLTARPTQVVGLLGQNGSGKSTTVKLLIGLLRPSKGFIRWHGVDIQQIPTDVDANWPFRLSPPIARQAVSVTRRLLLVLGVAPIAAVWLALTLVFWSPYDALRAVALMLVSGVALAELALVGWTKVPFAAAHEPASSTMRTKWPIYIVVLHMFGFMLAAVQREALASPNGTWIYLAWGAAAAFGLRLKGEWDLRGRTPVFDVEDDRLEVLNLSEASS
jgi:energy-coupling factor transporter ATP-binding protein EcfA2